MPYSKITSGKDKGKYRTPSGKVVTKDQIAAIEASKHKKKKR